MRLVVFTFFCLLAPLFTYGQEGKSQKIGIIDTKLVVKELEETKNAKAKLKILVDQWKEEIKKMRADLEKKVKDFQAKEILYTKEIVLEKQKEINIMKEAIADFQNQKFGPDGEYFQKQIEIMRPIQNRIFNAIKEIAKESKYDFIFDRSSNAMVLYVNEKYDITKEVLKKLVTN